jgi:hypothetical protein
MVRANRHLTRLCFIAVLAAILLGGWLASQIVSIRLDGIDLSGTTEGDWIDLVSSLGEEAIQLFMGLASE